MKCHLNYVVPDTQKWEQAAAYYIDSHAAVESFVKNSGLGFAIPYLHNGQMHDYIPDFIIRLKTEPPVHLILETKGVRRKGRDQGGSRKAVGGSGECRWNLWTLGIRDCEETNRRNRHSHESGQGSLF